MRIPPLLLLLASAASLSSLASAKAQGHYGGQVDVNRDRNQPPEAGAHDQPPPGYGRSHGGKLPHEEVFDEWKVEPGEEDRDAKLYRSQEDQFADLHNRILALTHHLGAVQIQIGKMYDRIDELHWKGEGDREELRHTRVPRTQVDNMEARINSIEKVSLQIANVMTSNDWAPHFEDLRHTITEHHHNLLFAVPQAVNHVMTTGGPRIGMLLGIVVLMQVIWAAAFLVYKWWKHNKPRKYL